MLLRSLSVHVLLSCSLLITACSTTKSVTQDVAQEKPKVAKEFRAAWVATVANINWPSKPGLSTQDQQKEAIALLDFLQKHHFNAVIFQVRPQADALYQSNLEPWSYYLTGQQGKAPNPLYDPLTFWVDAAHERGIELHVWLNPYRAHHVSGKEISDQSIVKTNPELVVKLKEGYYWMDPSLKGTQDRTTDVVMDLVKRYDIDGVHFDDYFYPYPSYNLNEDFPDSTSWNAYQKSGGKLSRGDWRRESVNQLISGLYKKIKAEKPHVKFGLSPFGIWRPGYPASVEGMDQYDVLYADARLWLNKGWVDYFTPQLYWPINRIPQSFPVLLGWWSQENTEKRHLWPGISVGRDTGYKTVNETINQIMISRGMLPESQGIVHWSLSSVTNNPKLAETLLSGPYSKKALVPASPWLDNKPPASPAVAAEAMADKLKLSWTPADEKDVFKWVVYCKYGNTWSYDILNKKDRMVEVTKTKTVNKQATTLTQVCVTAVDRTGNESTFKVINVQ
jgi:uncharacterized lipoprotein YddW (UPF0748 family)